MESGRSDSYRVFLIKEQMNSKIMVRDFRMGTGKTYGTIKAINNYPDAKVIYVTPFKTETERIKEACSGFYIPRDGYKREDLLNLVKEGKNVSTTHVLFETLLEKDYELFTDYTLILDEVISPVKTLSLAKEDVEILLNHSRINIGKDNVIDWTDDEYRGRDKELKTLINTGSVFEFQGYWFWKFPPIIFEKSFNEIHILTYQFEGSELYYYFLSEGIGFDVLLTDSSMGIKSTKEATSMLEVYEGKYNDIGKPKRTKDPLSTSRNPLSTEWYKKSTKQRLNKLSNATRNFLLTYCKANPDEVMYTCKKSFNGDVDSVGNVSPKGYAAETWVQMMERATNIYSKKKYMAYLVNLFMNPNLKNYYTQKLKDREIKIEVDQDKWALGMMIQWVWRGCIRKGEPMKIFIPSKRMRNMFNIWLNGVR